MMKDLVFLLLLLLCNTFLMASLHVGREMLRYIIAYIPLLLLSYGLTLRFVTRVERIRVYISAGVLALFLLGCARSVDPLTRAFCGFFSVGHRELYNVSHRDPLVYNLEFTKLQEVIEKVMAHIRPDENSVILFQERATAMERSHHLAGPLDRTTWARKLPGKNTFVPIYSSIKRLRGHVYPPRLHYIELPLWNSTPDLSFLSARYHRTTQTSITVDGITAIVHEFSEIRNAIDSSLPARVEPKR
jgi:hypothetical protein